MSQTVTSTRSHLTTIVGDRSLDVADLDIIQLERLIATDPVETAKLLNAAQSQGFFYVAFNDDLSAKIAGHLQTCYRNSHEFFRKPLDVKMKAFRDGVDNGYVSLQITLATRGLCVSCSHTYSYKKAGIESLEVGAPTGFPCRYNV